MDELNAAIEADALHQVDWGGFISKVIVTECHLPEYLLGRLKIHRTGYGHSELYKMYPRIRGIEGGDKPPVTKPRRFWFPNYWLAYGYSLRVKATRIDDDD